MATAIVGSTEFQDTQSAGVEHAVVRNQQLQSWYTSALADDATVTICGDTSKIDLPATFLVTGHSNAAGLTATGIVTVFDGDGAGTLAGTAVTSNDPGTATVSVAGADTDTDFCLYPSGTTILLKNRCGAAADIQVARLM